MDKRSDRGSATRLYILTTATTLFTNEGYEATSIELVLRRCGISRGALYHHFASKEALFTAVLEAAEMRIAQTVADAAKDAANPLDALRAGCVAWLRLALDPTIRRVVLIDAPSAVGWESWREIDGRNALGLLKAALQAAAAAGRVSQEMVETYAHMLLAVLIEFALLIARSNDANASIQAAQRAIEQVLSRLAGVEPNAPW